MALDAMRAARALHRFGFGPRAGSISAIATDPLGAIIAELDKPNAGQLSSTGMLTGGEINRVAFEFNAERQAKQRLENRRKEAAKNAEGASTEAKPPDAAKTAAMTTAAPAAAPVAPARPAPPPETPMQQNFFREAKARYDAAVTADIGFVERLVWFWSNHFCVSADATVEAGAYEREAIRPHVLGRFADMLLAAESHPAMLIFLNNAASMGPNSVAGINRNRGLNENLAREILELHTLGVRSGYTQDDVTNFAKVITGWTIYDTNGNPDHGGEFLYFPRLHEPGPQTVLGKAYRDAGLEQGRMVLADLARHPATAHHIATKLARHFIADTPPPALVDRLARRFIDTDGDLWQVAKALVTAPESWTAEQAKIKRPGEWKIALLRATGLPGNERGLVQATNRLGEPLWRPPAPKGFPDENDAWLEGLSHRLDTANDWSARFTDRLDPAAVLDTALGPLASTQTRQAVTRAESKAQAMTMVQMAPEFLRR